MPVRSTGLKINLGQEQMSKLSITLQAIIIVLLAIIIALVIYFGINPARTVKLPSKGSLPALIRSAQSAPAVRSA